MVDWITKTSPKVKLARSFRYRCWTGCDGRFFSKFTKVSDTKVHSWHFETQVGFLHIEWKTWFMIYLSILKFFLFSAKERDIGGQQLQKLQVTSTVGGSFVTFQNGRTAFANKSKSPSKYLRKRSYLLLLITPCRHAADLIIYWNFTICKTKAWQRNSEKIAEVFWKSLQITLSSSSKTAPNS